MIGRFLVCLLALSLGDVMATPYLNQHTLGRHLVAAGTNHQHGNNQPFTPDSETYQKADAVLKRRGYRILVIQIAKDNYNNGKNNNNNSQNNNQNTTTKIPTTQNNQENWYLHITAERGGYRYMVTMHYPSFKIISEKRL